MDRRGFTLTALAGVLVAPLAAEAQRAGQGDLALARAQRLGLGKPALIPRH
jgi:hypothetical protein